MGDDRVDAALPVAEAEAVAAGIEPGTVLGVSGFGSVGYPKAVPLALSRRSDAAGLDLTVLSGGSVGAEIDDRLLSTGAIARRYPFQAIEAARERINDGRVAFHDRHVSRVGEEAAHGGLPTPEVAVVEAVAAGVDDEGGWFVPSTSLGATDAFVACADGLVVEVNDAQPRGLEALHDVYRFGPPGERGPIPLSGVGDRIGSPRVRFDPDDLRAVVRTDRPDATYEFRDPTDDDRALASNLAGFLDEEIDRNDALADALALQFGVGATGNAVSLALRDVDVGDRRVAYFGEVIQDAVLDLLDEGALSAASATSLALSSAGQERLFDGLDRYAERIVLRPAGVSNHPGLIRRFGVVAVNSAVEVDLTGHVNSTHVGGTRMVNGIGGSGDYTRAALVSVIALHSTAAGGDVSRVVPLCTHVDHTEHDAGVIVTEHGVADLRGRSPRERAEAVIAVAHPDYRPALRAYRERALAGGGHSPGDLGGAFDGLARRPAGEEP